MKSALKKRRASAQKEMYSDKRESTFADEELDDIVESRLSVFLAFLLPVMIMLGILAGKSIYPFGENSFLRTDMYHQYAPFFAEFCRTLKEGRNLSFTFEIGLGTNYQALYAYYLASPLNWFVLLIPSTQIIEFMTYSIVLKIGFCGLTMAWYLKKHFHTNSMAITFFGTCYALCGYIAAYSWNIMWMDSLWLAPLILLGVERLVREARPYLYTITLALAILCNYYIAIMLCIFLVFFFLSEVLSLPELSFRKFLHRSLLFALFSLLAGGAAAIMLIPAAMALMNTASADSTFPSTLTSYFGLLDMLSRHLAVVDVEIGLEHWPNIYSGVVCFLLIPVYAISPDIPTRKKIAQISLLVFMLLGFSMNIPNYIWHGMHYPNSLPCRQSFLYTIVLLCMCYDGLRNLKDMSNKALAACFWGDFALIIVMQKLIDTPEVKWYSFYVSLGFIAVYALLLWLWKTARLQAATAIAIAFVLIIAETGSNMAVTSVTTTDRTEYWRNTENYQTLVEYAKEMEGDNFFRVEKSSRRTKNDGAWVGYNSASIFSSATEAGVSDFYKLFGMEGNTNAYSFTGATPLMESILSVRYRISSSEMTASELMEYVRWEDTAYLYHNIFTLPLGFMVPGDLDDYFTYFSGTPMAAQNAFVQQTTGTGDVLEEITGSGEYDTYTFDVPKDGRYFVYVGNRKVDSVTVSHDGITKSYDNVDRGYLVDLGICYDGESVTVTADDGNTLNASAWYFNSDSFIRWYEGMESQGMQVTNVTNNRSEVSITGTVTAEEDGTLLLSLPYEQGWTVVVDGAPVSTDAFVDALLSISLNAGTHTIHLEYETPGMSIGRLISLISALLILLTAPVSAMIHRRIRKRREAEEKARAKRQKRARQRELAAENAAEKKVPAAATVDPLLKEAAETLSGEDELLVEAAKLLAEEEGLTLPASEEVVLEDEEYLDDPADEDI